MDPGRPRCIATDHPLRIQCDATLTAAAPLAWRVYRQDTLVRVQHTPEGLDHSVVLWGLQARSTFRWEAHDGARGVASGTFETGDLPDGVDGLILQTTGTPAALDHFAVPFRCDGAKGFVVMGTDGEVRWYETVEATGRHNYGMTAFHWTGDGAIAVLGDDRIWSVRASGPPVFDVEGADAPFHHDIVEVPGAIVALNAAQHGDFVVDGLSFFEPATGRLLRSWSLADHVAVEGGGHGQRYWEYRFPNADDWSHANGISADGPDHLLLSLRHQRVVIRVVADLARDDFGAVDWILGDGVAPRDIPADLLWPQGQGFDDLHHPTRRSDGGLALFDNGDPEGGSRGLFLGVDVDAGTAHEETSWDLAAYCPNQGGTTEMPGGGALVTCNPANQISEFVGDRPDPVWTGTLSCTTGLPWMIQRARPVSLAP